MVFAVPEPEFWIFFGLTLPLLVFRSSAVCARHTEDGTELRPSYDDYYAPFLVPVLFVGFSNFLFEG
jgi:hypothetical protein